MIVLGQITPHYHAVSRFGSELSLGRCGWAMIASFIPVGITVLGLAAALWPTVASDRAGRLGARMVGAAGAAFLVAGIFVTDLNGQVKTIHGALHFGAAVVMFFVAVSIGGLGMARWPACAGDAGVCHGRRYVHVGGGTHSRGDDGE